MSPFSTFSTACIDGVFLLHPCVYVSFCVVVCMCFTLCVFMFHCVCVCWHVCVFMFHSVWVCACVCVSLCVCLCSTVFVRVCAHLLACVCVSLCVCLCSTLCVYIFHSVFEIVFLRCFVIQQYCGGKKWLMFYATVSDSYWCWTSSYRCQCPRGLTTCLTPSFWTWCHSLRTWPVWTMCTPYWEPQPQSRPVPLPPLSVVWPQGVGPTPPSTARTLTDLPHCPAGCNKPPTAVFTVMQQKVSRGGVLLSPPLLLSSIY